MTVDMETIKCLPHVIHGPAPEASAFLPNVIHGATKVNRHTRISSKHPNSWYCHCPTWNIKGI